MRRGPEYVEGKVKVSAVRNKGCRSRTRAPVDECLQSVFSPLAIVRQKINHNESMQRLIK